ncbi:MAG TPA: phenylalanine--tRNA ligase subunit beta, partial [Gemmatimonadales bacterium]|nr:phenylalanine--tRNA ligase subunit beta [Gemmatimonadales bacterium]
MNVSLAWLEAMLGRALDPQETAERLTLLGAAVDAVEPLYGGLDDVVVAEVAEVGKHPNADRLSLCKVNAGGELLEVICGAPNVTAGKRYPFAPVGATLPGGLTLERRKIRGIASNGMLCSAKELGLGTDHSGILELNTDAALGTPLVEALGLHDTRLVVDVTPNRPDLLGHRGVARDLAAAIGGTLRLAPIPGLAAKSKAARRVERTGTVDGATVTIEDTEGCPRYVAAVIRGVTVGPSPAWLQARLRSVGLRPINNVVDATNYILYEYGQPLHAFDLAHLRGKAVIVRRAKKGETLTTLDGVARALDPEMTMICDGEGPIAVAGVMGGENSEVGPETTDLLLECAAFDPKRIRKTRTQLKMSTDASYRFERGVDVQDLAAVARRAVDVIIAVAGGAEREAALDVFPVPVQPRTVFLRPARVEHLLGVPVTVKEIEGILTRLGFTVAPRDERVAVQVPGWRPDVTREVDLIEEIARIRGFDSFPVEVRPYRPTTVPEDPREPAKARLRTLLTGFGLHEARSIPFDAGGEGAQAIKNPLSQE